MGIMDQIESALAEPDTVSYVELRTDYNNKRKVNTSLRYTFKKFLEITHLNAKIRSSRTGTRCFAIKDIEVALENYSNSLKTWQSKAKGSRKRQSPKQRERARATINYGRVARNAIGMCSKDLQNTYGMRKKKRTSDDPKLSSLHSQIVAELAKSKGNEALVSEMNSLKTALDTATRALS